VGPRQDGAGRSRGPRGAAVWTVVRGFAGGRGWCAERK
jgi:hypothetical protein